MKSNNDQAFRVAELGCKITMIFAFIGLLGAVFNIAVMQPIAVLGGLTGIAIAILGTCML